MPSEWKVSKVTGSKLEQELNGLDERGYEIYKILPAGETLTDPLFTVVAKLSHVPVTALLE